MTAAAKSSTALLAGPRCICRPSDQEPRRELRGSLALLVCGRCGCLAAADRTGGNR